MQTQLAAWVIGLILSFPAMSANGSEPDDSALFSPDRMAYQAFDKLPLTRITVPGGILEVGVAPGRFDLPLPVLIAWITESAQVIAAYFAQFPAAHTRVLIVPVDGGGIRFGKAFGDGGAAIKIFVGRHSTAEDLERDWVMAHEMAHLAFPDVPDPQHWMEEGLATYVESIARLQSGQLSLEHVWGGFVRGMPHGLPKPGDQGLDHTPTWGRTYWGGALFCLLADIEIHRRTHIRYGLRDALRGIIAAGGSNQVQWPLARALAAGDEHTGVAVLIELYEQMKATPVNTDLQALWQDLGVAVHEDTVSFDDDAPLAAIRLAISSAAR